MTNTETSKDIEILYPGGLLISKKDGTRYTVKQVRIHEDGTLHSYYVEDPGGWGITIYTFDLDRFTTEN